MSFFLRWRVWRSFFVTTVICVVASGWLTPVYGGQTWQKVVAPQFTLYSSGKSGDAVRVAEEFQQFIEALGEIVRVETKALPSLTIVMFEREKEFRPFRPMKPNGKPWDVAGFFSRQDGWSVFGLTGSGLDEEVRRTVFHEGVHWFLSGFEVPNPPWLEEGLAEVFSTFSVEKGRRQWGQPIVEHVQVLYAMQSLPLERLLAVSRTNPLFNESQRTGLFYAESWAFIHYLLFGEHQRERTLFNDYLNAYRSGVHPDEAFKVVFKKDYAGMDRELSNYLRHGKYFVGSRPVSTAAGKLKAEPATDVEREVALARLALGADRLEEAQKHVVEAQRTGSDFAGTHEVAGYLASDRGDTAGMLESFAIAARQGSKDYRVYFQPAVHRHQSVSGFGGVTIVSQSEARLIADGYKRTLNLRPWFLPAYQGLGAIIGNLGPDNQQDRRFLEVGLSRYPGDGLILLGLAVASHQDGKKDEGRQRLTEVLATAEKREPKVNAYARALDDLWTTEEATDKIRVMAESQHYEEALAAIDTLLSKAIQPGLRTFLALNRGNIQSRLNMDQARRASKENRWSDARKLLEAIIASPGATGEKHEARRRLADLDSRDLGRN